MMFLDPTNPDAWPTPKTPYEAETLAFCRSWLTIQETYTLHTSGSTGAPKPIQLTRAQMRASAHLTGQTLGLQAGDKALVCLNIRYVAGIMMLVRGMELGLPMTIIEPSGNPLIDFDPATDQFAFTALVPLQLQTILTSDTKKLPILNKAKAVLVGGAATSSSLEQALQVITSPVFATYGMTETVSHIALRRLNGSEASEFFTALPGVDLGTDELNCLHITSAATNYTRVQTNDVVDLIAGATHENARFRLLGRADRIINSGGVKVQPEQIEQMIQTILAADKSSIEDRPGNRLFVTGLPDERLGQRIVVVREKEPINPQQWKQAQEAIRATLGPFSVPKEVITVAQFLETPTGKVDQKATVAQIR
ncbi:AMP-binding protein [Spirosoma pollinicola]|uniref:O-succinylbenzoic acid--CoA ligase n=1 Tax=Spirosoma pollinicola TaxID=2057025 RepID=A0A2K8YZ01_9BACT|nr:AMP-binding protein [Spirosoma pollinicola]AUD02867.1 O-succinylbenzoic acid--CoA ligase [Spirosoma pollinicola]